MFDDIDKKIKTLANVILWVTIIGGGLWLCFSLYNYTEYKDFLEYDTVVSDFHSKAVLAESSIIYSVILIISGIASSFLVYGFGQIIEDVSNISDKLNEVNKFDKDVVEEISKENDLSYQS